MPQVSNRILSICLGFFETSQSILRLVCLLVACFLAAGPASAQSPAPPAKCPPPSRLDSTKDTYDTTIVADPYRWLEDQNSPETRAWNEAQQKCTEAALSKLPDRDGLSKRLTELLHHDAFELPNARGGRFFFRKRLAGQDLMQFYVRRSLNGPDELLIDPLPWTPVHSSIVSVEFLSRDYMY